MKRELLSLRLMLLQCCKICVTAVVLSLQLASKDRKWLAVIFTVVTCVKHFEFCNIIFDEFLISTPRRLDVVITTITPRVPNLY